jgi:hypothetical protein
MVTQEVRWRAILWYKRGRNRQRWYVVGEGSILYASVMLAHAVRAWGARPNVDVVGTLVEMGA